MCVDLHTHSIYSDGTSTPEELVSMAVNLELKALALTDHDTVDGIPELINYGNMAGLQIISGVEISATHRERSLHILGYGINIKAPDFQRWLQPVQKGRLQRNVRILEKLRGCGIIIRQEELDKISALGQTGRPHIARLLIEKGVVSDLNQAFREYLGQGKLAYCDRFSYTAIETISMIHAVGGIAVLAHPGQLDNDFKVQPPLVRELSLRGLDGLEVFYPSHQRKMRKKLSKLAEQHNLLITGGSDFHGANRPANRLAGLRNAFCPPDTIVDALLMRQAKLAA